MSEEFTFEESEKNLHELKGWLKIEEDIEPDEEFNLVIPDFLKEENEPKRGTETEVS
ncbi:MAG: hypothetical protein GWN00_30630 [Aliifodinibius sp.]|nr:hypothetical protein [Fodinibius sp.]NIY28984.1 hypothetical protein [Fodinibius sp.]